MATKKQKHAEAMARREAFLADQREIGRQAIEKARRERESKELAAWEKGHQKHFKFVDECPHCAIVKREQTEAARLKAIEKVAQAAKAAHEKKEGVFEDPDAIVLHRTVSIQDVDPIKQPFSNKVNA